MPQFILLIREDLTRYPMPDAQLQQIIALHSGWAKKLDARGILRGGNGIPSEGKLLEMKAGQLVEGPIRDIKEGIGGFYIIEAETLDAAVAIAKECPAYETGDSIEVRPLM
ncbi:MAG: YciI family protein [Chitinophagales bacterium]